MTGLERYRAMLAGQTVDLPPRIPILMRFAAQHVGASYADFCTDWRVKSQANIRCAEAFGLDLVGVMSDPFTEAADCGAEIRFHDDDTPEPVRLPLEHTKDLSVLPPAQPTSSPRMSNTLATLRAYAERVGGRYTILGWVEGPLAEAADLRGVTQVMMDLYDDPGFLGELMDTCVDRAIAFARAQIQAGADTIGVGDALASQISRQQYERHVLPREHRLVDALRGMGAIVRLHICGDITHLLPAIAALPLDILDVDWMVPIQRVRAVMPPGVALGCNVDPVAVVLRGSPTSIRAAVRACYERVGDPFLVGAGCEIPPGTPPANLLALCQPITPAGG